MYYMTLIFLQIFINFSNEAVKHLIALVYLKYFLIIERYLKYRKFFKPNRSYFASSVFHEHQITLFKVFIITLLILQGTKFNVWYKKYRESMMIEWIISYLTLHLGSSIPCFRAGANKLSESIPTVSANLPTAFAAPFLTSEFSSLIISRR